MVGAAARGRGAVDAAVPAVAHRHRAHPHVVAGSRRGLRRLAPGSGAGQRHARATASTAAPPRAAATTRGPCRCWSSPTGGSSGSTRSSRSLVVPDVRAAAAAGGGRTPTPIPAPVLEGRLKKIIGLRVVPRAPVMPSSARSACTCANTSGAALRDAVNSATRCSRSHAVTTEPSDHGRGRRPGQHVVHAHAGCRPASAGTARRGTSGRTGRRGRRPRRGSRRRSAPSAGSPARRPVRTSTARRSSPGTFCST